MVWLTLLCLYELFHFPANFRSAAPLFTVNISNPVLGSQRKCDQNWRDRQSFDSEKLWHCDIFVTIHYHFNTFSLNIEYIGWWGRARGSGACHSFYSSEREFLYTTDIHFHFEKLLLESLLAKHRIRILWQILFPIARDILILCSILRKSW